MMIDFDGQRPFCLKDNVTNAALLIDRTRCAYELFHSAKQLKFP